MLSPNTDIRRNWEGRDTCLIPLAEGHSSFTCIARDIQSSVGVPAEYRVRYYGYGIDFYA